MRVHVTDQSGSDHDLCATPGISLMEIIRHAGLPIAAECGGACGCATCHVYVEDGWAERLPKRQEAETEMLDLAEEVQPNSRLSCQVALTEELDGLKVVLAPGSTY